MKTKLFLILVVIAGSGLITKAQTVDDLDISRRSGFDGSHTPRDPFLPVGWKKSTPVVQQSTAGVVAPPTIESYIKPAAFDISSISLDHRIPLAVINGQPYGEGDMFPFVAGTEKIRVQVYSIRDGEVTLRYKNYTIACPIRLGQKSTTPAK